MIIDNVRVIERERLPYAAAIGTMHTAESYYYMVEKGEPSTCLVFDVTVHQGDMKPLAPEKFVHEFMEKNYPDVEYHLERHLQAFDGMLEKLHPHIEMLEKKQHGKTFVYYYCYSNNKEAIDKLYRFVRSKPFMEKVEKSLEEMNG